MGLTYLDAAAAAFGHSAFSVEEFAQATGCRRPAKVLSEMRARGHLVRETRGAYRCLELAHREDPAVREWDRVHRAIVEAPMAWAWTQASARAKWTMGRDVDDQQPFRRVFHIAVKDEPAWRHWLRRRYVAQGRKAVGATVELHPWPRRQTAVVIDGEPMLEPGDAF